jgi:hypothetical protein
MAASQPEMSGTYETVNKPMPNPARPSRPPSPLFRSDNPALPSGAFVPYQTAPISIDGQTSFRARAWEMVWAPPILCSMARTAEPARSPSQTAARAVMAASRRLGGRRGHRAEMELAPAEPGALGRDAATGRARRPRWRQVEGGWRLPCQHGRH